MKAWGVNPTRSALLVVALLVAGCTVTPDMMGFMAPSSCAKIDQKALKFINWTKVPVVNVRIRQNEYSPMVIRLRQGWPYVIRIRNRDDHGHVFQANTFFSRVAVIKTTIAGKVKEETCYGAIYVPAQQTAELKLVAVVDGYYDYEDSYLFISSVFSLGRKGVIIVEERTPRI